MYIALRLIASSTHAGAVTPDSTEYLDGFTLRARPPVLPFVYAVLGENVHRITIAQGVIGAVCWLVLAATARRLVESGGAKTAMFITVLVVGACDTVARWDSALLSESLSISLGVLVLACLIRVIGGADRRWVIGLCAAAAAWAFTREMNAAFVVFGALVWVVWPHRRSGMRELAVGLAVPAILALALVASNSARTAPSLYDVVGVRVLADEGMTRYFESHGMPKSVERLRGRYSDPYDPKDPFRTAADLEGFRRWASKHGRITLVRYIVTHPRWSIGKPLRSPDMLGGPLTNPPLTSYGGSGYLSPLPAELQRLVFQQNNAALWVEVLAIAGVLAIGWRRGDPQTWVLPAMIAALGVPHALLAWHGDTLEVGRHGVAAVVQLRVGLAMVAVIAASRIRQEKFGREGGI
ncbi:MAG: hypothetical protein QOI61_2050 [Actinomycetota bacterium]